MTFHLIILTFYSSIFSHNYDHLDFHNFHFLAYYYDLSQAFSFIFFIFFSSRKRAYTWVILGGGENNCVTLAQNQVKCFCQCKRGKEGGGKANG